MATAHDRFAPVLAGLLGNSLATGSDRRPKAAPQRLRVDRSYQTEGFDRIWRPGPSGDRTSDPLLKRRCRGVRQAMRRHPRPETASVLVHPQRLGWRSMGTRSGTHPVHTEYQSELVPLSNPAGPT